MAEGNIAALVDKFKEICPKGKITGKEFAPFVDSLATFYGNKTTISNASDIAASKLYTKPTKLMDINAANVEKYYQEMVTNVKTYKKKITDGKSHDEKVIELFLGAKKIQKGTKTSTTGGVDRMTDASKYTGAHKERFNADGTGRGMDGRVDKANTSGYVDGYKLEGTYGKK